MPILPSLLQRPGALLVIAARTGQSGHLPTGPTQVDGPHLWILNLLADQGPVSQQEIGEVLAIDRTTMVEIVDELGQAGDRSPFEESAGSPLQLAEMLPRLLLAPARDATVLTKDRQRKSSA